MSHPDNKSLTSSAEIVDFIKGYEGLFLKSYKDPGGVWTIGYGTIGKEAKAGRRITKKTATKLLAKELKKTESYVRTYVDIPINQNQFDALVSFVYNVGSGHFRDSTLRKLLNRGQFTAAAGQFSRWNNQKSVETGEWLKLNGLTHRRQSEAALFLSTIDPEVDDSRIMPSPIQTDIDLTDGDIEVVEENGLSILNSDTFKALAVVASGVITALSSVLGQLKENPTGLVGFAMVVGGILLVLYVKHRDTKEGR